MKKKNKMITEKKFREKYKGRAKFRIAPGSDDPYNPATSRVIISAISDDATYRELSSLEDDLLDIFDVEVIIFN